MELLKVFLFTQMHLPERFVGFMIILLRRLIEMAVTLSIILTPTKYYIYKNIGILDNPYLKT